MRFGVIGTGTVGQAIARKLVALGHQVTMGSRTVGNEKALQFAAETGGSAGTFAAAAAFGEVIFNATNGMRSVEALTLAGAENLEGKVVVDISNTQDWSKKPLMTLAVANTDSMGEILQRTFPAARIVKSLNTVNARIMVDPASLAGDHAMFVSGNDPAAKAQVTELLKEFGWKTVLDLGDITGARGQEMALMLWVRVAAAIGSWEFNYIITKP